MQLFCVLPTTYRNIVCIDNFGLRRLFRLFLVLAHICSQTHKLNLWNDYDPESMIIHRRPLFSKISEIASRVTNITHLRSYFVFSLFFFLLTYMYEMKLTKTCEFHILLKISTIQFTRDVRCRLYADREMSERGVPCEMAPLLTFYINSMSDKYPLGAVDVEALQQSYERLCARHFGESFGQFLQVRLFEHYTCKCCILMGFKRHRSCCCLVTGIQHNHCSTICYLYVISFCLCQLFIFFYQK